MYAYLISHNRLGDNLFMIGALRFLLAYYTTIYFICKKRNYENVILFFSDEPRIICVPYDDTGIETHEIMCKIYDKYNNPDYDILVAGEFHKRYLRSKITKRIFLDYDCEKSSYTIEYDTITNATYNFIESFYQDIRLNLTHFYDYFVLPQTTESRNLYLRIRTYYIVFIQYKCSDGRHLDITKLLTKYKNEQNVLLISNDHNIYDFAQDPIKYELCQPFVFNKLVNYVDTIKNSDEIYIIDSCFIGLVLPYLKTGQLKTNKVRIIRRDCEIRL